MGSFLVPSTILGHRVELNIGMQIVQVLQIVERGGFEFHWIPNAFYRV